MAPVDRVLLTTSSRSLPLPAGRRLVLGTRPLIMGVVNVTSDSFSDGGRYLQPEAALAHALQLIEDGAELLDIGGESTRPGGGVYGAGASEVEIEQELARVLPVLDAVRARSTVPISVDTRKAAVARAALAHGADLINDVSALADPEMAGTVVDGGCAVILMHSRGAIATMQREIRFTDVVAEVRDDLLAAARRAVAAGVDPGAIVIDPGIGFGKTAAQNLALVRGLGTLRETGYPVLLGASRKSFIGAVSGSPVDRRLAGSLAAAGWAARSGAELVRVHDVAETRQFLDVWQAIEEAR